MPYVTGFLCFSSNIRKDYIANVVGYNITGISKANVERMKVAIKFLMLVMVICFASLSCTKYHGDKLNNVDKYFLVQASMSNTAEIQAGTLAATKASSAGVRLFGQMMMQDHPKAQADLKITGTNVGIPVRDTIDAQHALLMQQLTALSGRAFDSVYMKSQVNDHQNTSSQFQLEMDKGYHSFVRSYAGSYLPKIKAHLQMADSIAVAMKFK
jgi:putative membrane protein